jgi:hypothetical protein
MESKARRGSTYIPPEKLAQNSPRGNITISVSQEMETVRAGLFIGAEASFESMKHCFIGIKMGPPDVNFAVSELEHLRVGSPGV